MAGAYMKLTREIDETFAARWAAAWNGRALEAVLEHFRDDVVFTSPTALAVVGSPIVRGKERCAPIGRQHWRESRPCGSPWIAWYRIRCGANWRSSTRLTSMGNRRGCLRTSPSMHMDKWYQQRYFTASP
jgi:hypothetical protein